MLWSNLQKGAVNIPILLLVRLLGNLGKFGLNPDQKRTDLLVFTWQKSCCSSRPVFLIFSVHLHANPAILYQACWSWKQCMSFVFLCLILPLTNHTNLIKHFGHPTPFYSLWTWSCKIPAMIQNYEHCSINTFYLYNFSPESFWAGLLEHKTVKESNKGLIRMILARKSPPKSEVALSPVWPHCHRVLGVPNCLTQLVYLHVCMRPITEGEELCSSESFMLNYLVMIWSSGLSSKACVYFSMLASTSPRWKYKNEWWLLIRNFKTESSMASYMVCNYSILKCQNIWHR